MGINLEIAKNTAVGAAIPLAFAYLTRVGHEVARNIHVERALGLFQAKQPVPIDIQNAITVESARVASANDALAAANPLDLWNGNPLNILANVGQIAGLANLVTGEANRAELTGAEVRGTRLAIRSACTIVAPLIVTELPKSINAAIAAYQSGDYLTAVIPAVQSTAMLVMAGFGIEGMLNAGYWNVRKIKALQNPPQKPDVRDMYQRANITPERRTINWREFFGFAYPPKKSNSRQSPARSERKSGRQQISTPMQVVASYEARELKKGSYALNDVTDAIFEGITGLHYDYSKIDLKDLEIAERLLEDYRVANPGDESESAHEEVKNAIDGLKLSEQLAKSSR